MTRIVSGSCLCSAVTFEVSGKIDAFFLCHCSRCRKDTGSAHASNLFAADATLTWLTGGNQVRTFRLPDTRHAKSFCSVCGSALPTVEANGVTIPAGSLDDIVAIRPDAHIFGASRAAWDYDLDDVPVHDGLPGVPSSD